MPVVRRYVEEFTKRVKREPLHSVAAGEGNPDRAVRLSDEGFCYRRFLAGNSSEYFRPGRDGYGGNRSCEGDAGNDTDASAWARQSARWESGPCHRSLYSYQLRTALALAVESPHIAVTYLPLACSGATISAGFLGGQRIVECASPGTTATCPDTTRAQMTELSAALDTLARSAVKQRAVFLTDFATVELHDGNLDHACKLAATAADQLHQAGYATGTGRLREFRLALEPWNSAAPVSVLDEQLDTLN